MAGRPRLPQPISIQLTLRLRPGEDDDLISFYRRVPSGQRVIATKAAMRHGGLAVRDMMNDDGGIDSMIDILVF